MKLYRTVSLLKARVETKKNTNGEAGIGNISYNKVSKSTSIVTAISQKADLKEVQVRDRS